jgi:hypothetical protein
MIKTTDYYNSASVGNLYTDGAVTNIGTFHDNIVKGDHSNPSVAPSVRSNLTTILGRTAAYRGEVVTWDQMMRKKEAFKPDLKGLKA